jgi:hypothetical protein
MNKDEARKLLDRQKVQLKNNLKKYQDAEKVTKVDEFEADVLGPRNDLEYQRLTKDIKESEDDENKSS